MAKLLHSDTGWMILGKAVRKDELKNSSADPPEDATALKAIASTICYMAFVTKIVRNGYATAVGNHLFRLRHEDLELTDE